MFSYGVFLKMLYLQSNLWQTKPKSVDWCNRILKQITLTFLGPMILIVAVLGSLALTFIYLAILLVYFILLLFFTVIMCWATFFRRKDAVDDALLVLWKRVPIKISNYTRQLVQSF